MVAGMARAKLSARCLEAGSNVGRSQAKSLGTSEDPVEFAVTEWTEN